MTGTWLSYAERIVPRVGTIVGSAAPSRADGPSPSSGFGGFGSTGGIGPGSTAFGLSPAGDLPGSSAFTGTFGANSGFSGGGSICDAVGVAQWPQSSGHGY